MAPGRATSAASGLGAAGSYLVATTFARNLDFSAFQVASLALPTIASVCIGLWHSHRADGGRPVAWAGFFSSLFLGGTVAGALIGAAARRMDESIELALFGAAFGFCMTFLFAPVLSAAFFTWKRIGDARSPSIADASVRQRLWSATALGLAFYAYGLMSVRFIATLRWISWRTRIASSLPTSFKTAPGGSERATARPGTCSGFVSPPAPTEARRFIP